MNHLPPLRPFATFAPRFNLFISASQLFSFYPIMDRDTRNLLANTTQALRRGLEEEFALQLEGRFDVLRDGSIADAAGPQLDDSEKLTRRKIVEAISWTGPLPRQLLH